jgi:hypothetical protein
MSRAHVTLQIQRIHAMRVSLIAALLAASALPALADQTAGTVVAFDRVAKIVVLEDKSVWSLETMKEIPAGLKAGDVIEIDYTSNGDNGWARINSVTIKG